MSVTRSETRKHKGATPDLQDNPEQLDPPAPGAALAKVNLITDLRRLSYSNAVLSRDFYRANGKYTEREWQKYWPTFKLFLEAAGIQNKTQPQSEPEPIETDAVNGDLRSITLVKTEIHTLDALLEHCKVDLALWEVERFTVNKWEVGATNSGQEQNGSTPKQIITENLFQVKATLRKRVNVAAALNEIATMKVMAKLDARYPRVEIGCVVPSQSGNLLEVNIPDHHFGKLAWSAETGYENYDVQIAEQMYLRALEMLLRRVKGTPFEQIVYVVGNDLLNADDLEGRTTKGTFVSTDGRYQKTFATVRRTIKFAIERLRKIAPVKVVMVSGNHDNLSVWHLGDSLECYFVNYPDVEIDNQPRARKYHHFGDVMLMFTHGDKGKRTDYPLLMAAEQPEMFGATKYREVHTGHTHQTKTEELHGIRVRVLPALCPPDAWHAEMGFVGNLRSAEAYVWNDKEGLVQQVFYNDAAHPAIVTKREVV